MSEKIIKRGLSIHFENSKIVIVVFLVFPPIFLYKIILKNFVKMCLRIGVYILILQDFIFLPRGIIPLRHLEAFKKFQE